MTRLTQLLALTGLINRIGGTLHDVISCGRRVVIVGHSAGGWVATEAAQPEL